MLLITFCCWELAAIGHAGDFPRERFNSRFGDMNSRLASHKFPFWETREIGGQPTDTQ